MSHELNAGPAARHGLLLIVAAAVLWGTVGVATKGLFTLSDTNPLSIGFFRLAIAVPALALASWRALGRRAFAVRRRDALLMFVIGGATALYQVCYFAAIARVGVSIAVLVTLCTAPVMVALLSAALLRERLAPATVLALACALGGTGLLVGIQPGEVAGGSETLTGIGLALGSGFGYAVLAICSRRLAGGYHPLQPITFGFAAGALLLLPFALAGGLVASYSAAGWALLLHLGLVPTALAYALYLAGMRSTSATTASIVTLLEPLTSTALAAVLFGERLGPTGLAGAALLLCAIGVLYRGVTRQPQAARA